MKKRTIKLMLQRLFTGLFFICIIFEVGNCGNIGFARTLSASKTFNVKDYGAVGNGEIKDTDAINNTIDACALTGGGVVYFPPGKYLSGAINLKSHITLYIDAGAVILASQEVEDYPLIKDPWSEYAKEENRILASVINGDGLVNIAITGRGTIDGQGEPWWRARRLSSQYSRMNITEPLPGKEKEFEEAKKVRYGRPNLIKLVNCRDIYVEGLKLLNSPSWTFHSVFCEQMTIHNLTLISPPDSPNTDGINPVACKNVHISNCHIDVGDDCITLKSGKDELGRNAGKPCENITITNCTMIHGHGGVVIGSEMSGGVKNVSISNCVFHNTDKGIRLKTRRGRGGVVENIAVSNIVMENVKIPINIIMFYQNAPKTQREPITEGTPVFRNVIMNNIIAKSAETAGRILGLGEMPIRGISMSNIRIFSKEGLLCHDAEDIVFHNVRIDVEKGSSLTCRDVTDLEIDNFRTNKPHSEFPAVELKDVKRAFIHNCSPVPGTATFINLSGSSTEELVFKSNNFIYAKKPIAKAKEVKKDAIVK